MVGITRHTRKCVARSGSGSEQLQRTPSIGPADGVGDKIDPQARRSSCASFSYVLSRSSYVFFIINTNYHRLLTTCLHRTRKHILAGKQLSQALRSAAVANGSVDQRQLPKLGGCRIDRLRVWYQSSACTRRGRASTSRILSFTLEGQPKNPHIGFL